MASKKAKREAGLAKREAFLAEERARGLAAQEVGRRSHEDDRRKMAEAAQRINIRHKDTINRIATAVQKKQIERETGERFERLDAMKFDRGNRV